MSMERIHQDLDRIDEKKKKKKTRGLFSRNLPLLISFRLECDLTTKDNNSQKF